MILEEIKNIKSGKRELRKFGITMSAVLLLLGVYPGGTGKIIVSIFPVLPEHLCSWHWLFPLF